MLLRRHDASCLWRVGWVEGIMGSERRLSCQAGGAVPVLIGGP